MELLKNLYTKWCEISDVIRFIIIGGVNFLISYLIFALAVLTLGEAHYQICVILQWTISSVFSYFNQKFFVFCTRGNYIKEYLKCCSTWLISYLLNVVILEILVRFVTKNVYVSQFVSIGIVSVSTYVLFKYFAFKPKNTNN